MEIPKPFKDIRPWGEELWLTKDSPSMVKILTVNPAEACSLQYHEKRDEFWRVLSGNGTIVLDDKEIQAKANDEYFIPRKTKHRFMGGTEPLVLLELTYGEFDEKDIVRLEDKYGRT